MLYRNVILSILSKNYEISKTSIDDFQYFGYYHVSDYEISQIVTKKQKIKGGKKYGISKLESGDRS